MVDHEEWNDAVDQCEHIPGWTEELKRTVYASKGWRVAITSPHNMPRMMSVIGEADNKPTQRFSMDGLKGWVSNVAKNGVNMFSLPQLGKIANPPMSKVPRVQPIRFVP